MPEKAASTLPGNARPLVHSDRGCHCRWPGWLGLMERFGLTRSMSAKGCSPDNAAAEGFFGRMKTEAVYPEKWEEHTRNEVLALVDEYIRWYNHERIKQSLGWMSPVQYRQSQVVPEKLRTLDRGRPWRDSQFASTRLSPSRDMSR